MQTAWAKALESWLQPDGCVGQRGKVDIHQNPSSSSDRGDVGRFKDVGEQQRGGPGCRAISQFPFRTFHERLGKNEVFAVPDFSHPTLPQIVRLVF